MTCSGQFSAHESQAGFEPRSICFSKPELSLYYALDHSQVTRFLVQPGPPGEEHATSPLAPSSWGFPMVSRLQRSLILSMHGQMGRLRPRERLGPDQSHTNHLCWLRIGSRLCWFPREASRGQEAGLQNCLFIQTQVAISDLEKTSAILTQTLEGHLHIHCPFSPEHHFLRTTYWDGITL